MPLNSVEGIVGNRLGESARISDLNLNSTDCAEDNQYFAIYEQLGVVGILRFAILIVEYI